MNDLPPRQQRPSDEIPENVYRADFSDKVDRPFRIHPSELSDQDVVELFLSQLSHPSTRGSSARLAGLIHNTLGPNVRSDVTLHDLEWRQRMSGLMVEIEALHPDVFKTLLARDSILRELHEAFAMTRSHAEQLKQERNALVLLQELRAGTTTPEQDTFTDERWRDMIKRLVGDQET